MNLDVLLSADVSEDTVAGWWLRFPRSTTVTATGTIRKKFSMWTKLLVYSYACRDIRKREVFFVWQGSLFTERWAIAGGSNKCVQKRKVTEKERCLEKKGVQTSGRKINVSGKKCTRYKKKNSQIDQSSFKGGVR